MHLTLKLLRTAPTPDRTPSSGAVVDRATRHAGEGTAS
jgi:hypothetical protein